GRLTARLLAHGADLVGAPAGPGDHVLHALDSRLREHGPDEVDLAAAGLAVTLGDGPDGAVVLDDSVEAGRDLLVAGEVAVLVEDPRELGDLGAQTPLGGEAGPSGLDAVFAAPGEEVVDELRVGVGGI